MRRTVTATCLLLAGLVTGCSGGGQEAADSKASASASPSVDPVVAFMSSVEDAGLNSYATGIPPYQEMEVFPPKWCTALDAGHSAAWMFGEGDLYPWGGTWGTEKTDAYQVLVLGVKAYCPQHSKALAAELRDAGVY
ncbi:hypothetical protein OHT77_00965 [Streptomyces sp. NBC_00252]|uniref:hypothetical protein n=1 Tax=Streptomyces sp. NBC_00252 TaxID=2975691 RepID=UPI002E2B5B49|nr:hypothetical protein [Streptomyces sp. NBC_00252]